MTVPCAIPVGMAFRPAALAAAMTSSGRAGVAMSTSVTGCAEQRVAHGAADDAGGEAPRRERREHGLRLRALRASGAAPTAGMRWRPRRRMLLR